MIDKYAVIGNPVAHSKSPLIHAECARQTGQSLSYTALRAPLDIFTKTVLKFRGEGGKGINVTLPFKQEAWKLANVHTGYALEAGAVNTIAFKGTGISGHKTHEIAIL